MHKKPASIDEYIAVFPKEQQERMEELRRAIKEAAPETTETIGYGIPTFKYNGKNVVHFGGFKNHIGFYPSPSGIKEFEKELAEFGGGKGTIQFPNNQKIPLDLVKKVVRFRLKEASNKK